ncbi:unnamed protein product [Strongylus vulgaris]|uniref:Uncharacterized protein n=1 Tax=Strongylus vulgaris TaxID=40348 RepID=A0A3P7K0J1_STRVU|nr:unnamed protein product [Strongylus vulgaris]
MGHFRKEHVREMITQLQPEVLNTNELCMAAFGVRCAAVFRTAHKGLEMQIKEAVVVGGYRSASFQKGLAGPYGAGREEDRSAENSAE